MRQVYLKDDFRQDYISRAAGERLRRMIQNAAEASDTIEIDFKEVIVASTSFFDEGFAKLALEGWDKNRFEQVVKLKNLNPRDAKVMDKMCAYRGLR